MKAKELIKKLVKEDERENVCVIAISKTAKVMHWFHVHLDEELPLEKDYDVAITQYNA